MAKGNSSFCVWFSFPRRVSRHAEVSMVPQRMLMCFKVSHEFLFLMCCGLMCVPQNRCAEVSKGFLRVRGVVYKYFHMWLWFSECSTE